MKRVEYVIDENLLVIVTHAAIGDFQIGGDGHRLVDREEGIEIVVLEDVTAALLRTPVAHLQHTFDAVRSAKLQQEVFITYERMLIKTGLIGKLYGKSVQFSRKSHTSTGCSIKSRDQRANDGNGFIHKVFFPMISSPASDCPTYLMRSETFRSSANRKSSRVGAKLR